MKKKKVVVIDDDEVTLKLLSGFLADNGMDAHLALNAAAGFFMAKTEKPDLIILDVYMPGMDGLTLLSELRRHPATCHTPVLMLSDEAKVKGAGIAIDLGADGYIAKPFKPSELNHKINALIDLTS